MDPILCHICNKPLQRYKILNNSNWECMEEFVNTDDPNEFEPTGHCSIITNPKQNGIVLSYKFMIEGGNILEHYIIESNSELGQTILLFVSYIKDPVYSISPIIKKFYPIKLKEPLAPQFMQIYENVKLFLVFS